MTYFPWCQKSPASAGRVCVKHLKRCKTSTAGFHVGADCINFISLISFQAGGHSISLGLCPTKLPVKWDIQPGQLDVPASVLFPRDGTWLTLEPPCRFFFQTVSNQTQTLSVPFDVTSLPVRLSQSVWREPFLNFLASGHQPFPVRFYWSVFLHVRCMPHQNSQ